MTYRKIISVVLILLISILFKHNIGATNAQGSPTLTITPASLDLTEGGASVLVTLDILNPEPGAIIIDFTSDSQCEVRPLAAGGFSSSLSFLIPPAVLPITFEVRAVDDAAVEGPHTCTITTPPVSGSTNPLVGYDPPDLVFNITDDEPFP